MTLIPGSREDLLRRVFLYHRRTKHHLHRYAASLGHLDWATQPDPFRTYAGAPVLELPLLADALAVPYADLFEPGAVRPRKLDVHGVAVLFELALGLSAWKEFRGSRWALRCNPSSGNLHPTEGYAVLPAGVPGVAAGVYHYVSRDHSLEQRCAFSDEQAGRVSDQLPAGSFLVGLSSIHWREAWKYGERAYRYCQHDVGHAVAAVRYAAAALGWSARLLDGPSDEDVATLLGLNDQGSWGDIAAFDREHPDALLLLGPHASAQPPAAGLGIEGLCWQGRANPLSPGHVAWEAIDTVAEAARKPRTEAPPPAFAPLPALEEKCLVPASTLIRQRRSCLGLDGVTALEADVFYSILDHLLPRREVPPWDVLPWEPLLHPAVFVHRVRGLRPGLYLLERSDEAHDRLRAACKGTFAWTRPDGCPGHLRLFLLEEGDFRARARTISCHQDIASDGAFALGMIADFEECIRGRGPWWYRRLFWEAGVLGQVLYLGAEAAGVRGTGIGCYFDDPMHEALGLQDDLFQSMYHFTVGGPVEDPRLRTIAPYAHLGR